MVVFLVGDLLQRTLSNMPWLGDLPVRPPCPDVAPCGAVQILPKRVHCPVGTGKNSYLVDPASSHMLVSKIKPCMSKYKHFIL